MEASTLSLLVSFLSLYVAGRVAWNAQFRPAKVVGVLKMLYIFCIKSKKTNVATDWLFVPHFWVRNVGARTLVIEDLRLRFAMPDGAEIYAKAESEVDVADLESASGETSVDQDNEPMFPISTFFGGFSLAAGEVWSRQIGFKFYGDDRGCEQKLIGTIPVSLEGYFQTKKAWRPLLSCNMDFSLTPHHLLPWSGSKHSSYYFPMHSERG